MVGELSKYLLECFFVRLATLPERQVRDGVEKRARSKVMLQNSLESILIASLQGELLVISLSFAHFNAVVIYERHRSGPISEVGSA